MSGHGEGREKIGFCGLYCGDCYAHQGKIADLARDLRAELRKARFETLAEWLSQVPFFRKLKDYKTCYEVLGSIVKFRCSKGCREGGGPPFCKVRGCCGEKEIEGCWECDEFKDCNKREFVEALHGDAHLANLRKLKKQGIDAFLAGKRYWFGKEKKG